MKWCSDERRLDSPLTSIACSRRAGALWIDTREGAIFSSAATTSLSASMALWSCASDRDSWKAMATFMRTPPSVATAPHLVSLHARSNIGAGERQLSLRTAEHSTRRVWTAQLPVQVDQPETRQWQPFRSSHASSSAGLSPLQAAASPAGQDTCLARVPVPHEVLQDVQAVELQLQPAVE